MATAAPSTRPLLRGWSHVVSFPLMVGLGIALVVVPSMSVAGRLVLGVYVAGTATMFGMSALYHRGRWSPRARSIAQRLDHSAIFLAIAGGYTPVVWATLDGWWRIGVLGGAWLGAAIGITLHWVPSVPEVLRGASYLGVGWIAVVALPPMLEALGVLGFALILAGGVCYTIGAVCLFTERPDPWPRVFGFHEVFHAFTVVAAGLQFAAIAVAVTPRL